MFLSNFGQLRIHSWGRARDVESDHLQILEVKTVKIIYQVWQQQQPQLQLLWQQMQMKSKDITIKMMDIYMAEE